MADSKPITLHDALLRCSTPAAVGLAAIVLAVLSAVVILDCRIWIAFSISDLAGAELLLRSLVLVLGGLLGALVVIIAIGAWAIVSVTRER